MLEDYPSKEAPLTELDAPHLPLETQSWLQEQLAARFCAGEVTLYAWIAWLQEQEHVWAPQPAAPITEVLPTSRRGCPISAEGTPSQLGASNQQPEVSIESDHAVPPIMHGKPFTDRKSTFQVGNIMFRFIYNRSANPLTRALCRWLFPGGLEVSTSALPGFTSPSSLPIALCLSATCSGFLDCRQSGKAPSRHYTSSHWVSQYFGTLSLFAIQVSAYQQRRTGAAG